MRWGRPAARSTTCSTGRSTGKSSGQRPDRSPPAQSASRQALAGSAHVSAGSHLGGARCRGLLTTVLPFRLAHSAALCGRPELSVGAGVLFSLEPAAVVLGAASLGLVGCYPLAKRFIGWPQAVTHSARAAPAGVVRRSNRRPPVADRRPSAAGARADLQLGRAARLGGGAFSPPSPAEEQWRTVCSGPLSDTAVQPCRSAAGCPLPPCRFPQRGRLGVSLRCTTSSSPVCQVSHDLQLQSLWIIPNAAVS